MVSHSLIVLISAQQSFVSGKMSVKITQHCITHTAQAILLEPLTYTYCIASNGDAIMHKKLEKIMNHPWQNFKTISQHLH
jgi:hypothetical protein